MAQRKVTVKGDGAKSLLIKIEKALRSDDVMRQIAQFTRDRIYTNTKRGYYAGVRKNLAKLRPLSDGYIKYRQSLLRGATKEILGKRKSKRAKKNAKAKAITTFGPFFSPKRSNLTLTGQMLEALDATVVGGKAKIFVQASSRTDGLTNKEVAAKVAENGRAFLGLDDNGIDRIRRSIISVLRRLLKRR
jgi:hypothetical protein